MQLFDVSTSMPCDKHVVDQLYSEYWQRSKYYKWYWWWSLIIPNFVYLSVVSSQMNLQWCTPFQ